MATGGRFHEDDLDSDWMQVYVSFLRIAGAALTGGVHGHRHQLPAARPAARRPGGAAHPRRRPRRRLRAEPGRLPRGGGAGAAGHRPVVIEMSPDNRFVTTARRLGAAVIVGDLTVAEVLRQANAGTARAVVAATNHDLVNLEVGPAGARAEPGRSAWYCSQSDPQLAQMLREAANVRLAVSHAGPGGAGLRGGAIRRPGAERLPGRRAACSR